MYVCVREREWERERKRDYVCVCVSVCVTRISEMNLAESNQAFVAQNTMLYQSHSEPQRCVHSAAATGPEYSEEHGTGAFLSQRRRAATARFTLAASPRCVCPRVLRRFRPELGQMGQGVFTLGDARSFLG